MVGRPGHAHLKVSNSYIKLEGMIPNKLCHDSVLSNMAHEDAPVPTVRRRSLTRPLAVSRVCSQLLHKTFPYFDDINSQFPAIHRPRAWPVKTDPSRELCSQVLQYDERILTRLSDWCAPHIPCYTGTPIQSDPKTIVEQSLVRPQPVGPSLEGLAFCNHVQPGSKVRP